MPNRRQFIRGAATATAGLFLTGRDVANLTLQQAPPRRREISIGGRRITTVDIHGHFIVPEVRELIKGNEKLTASAGDRFDGPLVLGPDRLRYIDEQGIDVQALSINAWWYAAERDLARDIISIQNRKLADWCAAHPGRFVGLASVALQHPDLAAEQLQEAVTKLGFRGAAIGGSVEGEELSARRFDPFWSKAEELGVLVFMHPQPAPGTTLNPRLQGKGALGNTIGNPLETTVFLSHLIFEGTLDRFPGVKICAAHGGGYLPSYGARSDAVCQTFPQRLTKPLKKQPTEYLRQMYYDSIVFTPEALRHLAAETGTGQIVMGTDYPFPWTSTSVDHILNTPGFSDNERAAMLGETAMKLLGIKA